MFSEQDNIWCMDIYLCMQLVKADTVYDRIRKIIKQQ